jgi:hypothetical protein
MRQQVKCKGCGKIFWSKSEKVQIQGKKQYIPEKFFCQKCRNLEKHYTQSQTNFQRRKLVHLLNNEHNKQLVEEVASNSRDLDHINPKDYNLDSTGTLYIEPSKKTKAFVFDIEKEEYAPKLIE